MHIEKVGREKVIAANKLVHAKLVTAGDYQKSPHFYPENKATVRKILESLSSSSGCQQANLLDIGCGTGFIIGLSHDLFHEVHGIDITDEMLKEIDLAPGNIVIRNAFAEDIPYENEYFDVVTAYSFLDHVFDYLEVLGEVVRVLKPGGVFYADLNPNARFNQALIQAKNPVVSMSSAVVSNEITKAFNNGEYYEKHFDIDAETLTNAEPGKSFNLGFDKDVVRDVALRMGFSNVKIEPVWFLGQGEYLRQNREDDIDVISRYLNSIQPVSDALYKYLRFTFRK